MLVDMTTAVPNKDGTLYIHEQDDVHICYTDKAWHNDTIKRVVIFSRNVVVQPGAFCRMKALTRVEIPNCTDMPIQAWQCIHKDKAAEDSILARSDSCEEQVMPLYTAKRMEDPDESELASLRIQNELKQLRPPERKQHVNEFFKQERKRQTAFNARLEQLQEEEELLLKSMKHERLERERKLQKCTKECFKEEEEIERLEQMRRYESDEKQLRIDNKIEKSKEKILSIKEEEIQLLTEKEAKKQVLPPKRVQVTAIVFKSDLQKNVLRSSERQKRRLQGIVEKRYEETSKKQVALEAAPEDIETAINDYAKQKRQEGSLLTQKKELLKKTLQKIRKKEPLPEKMREPLRQSFEITDEEEPFIFRKKEQEKLAAVPKKVNKKRAQIILDETSDEEQPFIFRKEEQTRQILKKSGREKLARDRSQTKK